MRGKFLVENYRPISLLSQMYKVLSKIITNKLTNKLDEYQPVDQAAFRKGFSACDQLLMVKILIEKRSNKISHFAWPLLTMRKLLIPLNIEQ